MTKKPQEDMEGSTKLSAEGLCLEGSLRKLLGSNVQVNTKAVWSEDEQEG
jgi:hypothetical protein